MFGPLTVFFRRTVFRKASKEVGDGLQHVTSRSGICFQSSSQSLVPPEVNLAL